MGLLQSSRITAVLGPTNTGKTYFAMERMLAYSSGIMGFPLRLLARENYDKAIKIKGSNKCALVTGEEKVIPPAARYFFCTVESMPLDRLVEFVAVDEIQLCADEERGHIFTDRLMNLRGTAETMFMGSSTIAPIIRKLVRDVEFVERPRFSKLSYNGTCRVTRVPPRSAVVAFSASDVYQTAEMMRQARGGTAVVLGALSPRTRNSQVELFENGDVDYMVATDAIGMGLNLNVDHVTFSRMGKFDGRISRRLTPAEVGQIAGRAGRHTRDGTFGTTNEVGGMDQELIDRIESHNYADIAAIYWRNPDLDFRSPKTLIKSLERRTTEECLLRVRDAEDHQALVALAMEGSILDMAKGRQAVELLWDVCQVPDFRKTLTDQHIRLLSQIYHFLMTGKGKLDTDWVAQQIERIDKTGGDIDTLVQRIAWIRTWTYISHRENWLEDAEHWQGQSRAIEDRLSDALHERLTQRFVDKRAATLVRSLRAGERILASVKANGDVVVEGELLGRVEGFAFTLDSSLQGGDVKPALTAARKALLSDIPERVALLEQDNDGSFLLDDQAQLTWRGVPIGKITKGDAPLKPLVEVYNSEFLDGPSRERIRVRMQGWLDRHLKAQLKALFALQDAKLDAGARGLAYQLSEELGSVQRRTVRDMVNSLGKDVRKEMGTLGVRIGREYIFVPSLMRPRPSRLRALLWANWNGNSVPALPDFEATHFEPSDEHSENFCKAIGYRLMQDRKGKSLAVRIDVLERLSHEAFKLLRGEKPKTEAAGPAEENKAEESKTEEKAAPADATPVASEAPEAAVPGEEATPAAETEAPAAEETPSETAADAEPAEAAEGKAEEPEIPEGSFAINDAMRDMAKMDETALAFTLKSLRFHPTRLKGGLTVFSQRQPGKGGNNANRNSSSPASANKQKQRNRQRQEEKARMADSPFAVLQSLKTGKR
ncbi:helicase-related protein [Kiloniella sp. b19]|uniref:helicase-related protein n=1 Tax=Kiloniella sp. GXU_MW_B19 TaxID=3141326 RepID=UPI0031E0EE88